MNNRYAKSNEMWRRAAEVIPLGTNSNFRFGGETGTYIIERGKGAYLWDVDGNRYIDYKMAMGPVILGHAYDEVDDFVREAVGRGNLYAATHPMEIALAEKLVELCPCVQQLRMNSSGTEATMHALRVARGYTGRDKFIKFEGHYHGQHDYVLFSMYVDPVPAYGHRRAPIPVVESAGIPKVIRDTVITLPFNDFEALDLTLRRSWFEIAAILVEPVMGNCASIEPLPGWLEFLRARCDEYGIVLIFDEVKTGFRVALGGAQEIYGVIPDLATYAKAMANGYAISFFGGKKEIMAMYAPGGVEHCGTYNANVVGVSAALATLNILTTQPVLQTIAERGRRLMAGLRRIFEEAGVPVSIYGPPAMFGWTASPQPPTDQREYAFSDAAYLHRVVQAAIDRGLMLARETREPWFLSYSHSDADIDETLNIMADAVRAVRR
jgi:glutamate-1-semialdehyde 2,1-aminomutase